ncbi:unnamed protein product [Caenorhabditis sp. 36 PRJEB53466]|nr:unnamed protein product [Caenorhabditis sp. 36 PRJEB53466]
MDNSREALLAQMMEITNCQENVALNYLTRTNFDIEIAIRHFFEGTVPESVSVQSNSLPSPSVAQSSSQSSSRSLEQTSSPDTTPEPSASEAGPVLPRYHSILQWFTQFITLPVRLPLMFINLVYAYLFGMPKTVYPHIFEYIEKHYSEFNQVKASVFYGRQLQNLRSDLQQNEWKFLVAYMHNPHGDDTFLKSLFTSDFAEQVRNHGAVFFGCIMGSDDANRLRPDRTFGKTRKSCVIVFVIRGTSLTRRLLIDQLHDPESVNTNINLALIDLIADEADRIAQDRERNETRLLMQEQNREYQESLQRDLERIANSKKEKEDAEKAEQEDKKKKEESEMRVKKIENYKDQLRQSKTPLTGPHDILIRFPTGKKVVKFHEDESIEKLFEEALKSELCPLFFQMHQSFPKKAVPCLPKWYYDILICEELEPKEECFSSDLTFAEAGITHGATVFIDNL